MIEISFVAFTFVVYASALFVYIRLYNKDNIELVFGLLGCVFGALFWFVTLPAILLLGVAWLISKAILKMLEK
jgi:hypothetical protein